MPSTFSGLERDDRARSRGRGGGSRWRRRLVAGVGAVSLAVGITGIAYADAPDPTPNSAVGRIVANPAGAPAGAVTIEVEGNWQWPTHRSDCNQDRWAVGWAVDWNDPSNPGPVTLTGTDKNGNRISADPGTTKATAWSPADPYTHYNGGQSPYAPGGPRCGTYNAALDYNQGHWGPIRHTYVTPPATLNACVVTYDLHDGGGLHPETQEPGIKTDDGFTSAGDNSIEKNGSTPGGNQCAAIVIPKPLTISVEKTNNANGDAAFGDDETAAAAGSTVPFRVTVTNTSQNSSVEITAFKDAFSGQTINVCNGVTGNNVIGSVLAVGGSVTCNFSLTNYSPAAGGSLENTVTVDVKEPGNANNTASGSDKSIVRTTAAAPVLVVEKGGPATAVSGTEVDYPITVTNTGNANANLPLTVIDELPAGETFVSATGANCTPTVGPGNTNFACALPGAIAANGGTYTFTVRVRFADTATGPHTDCARIAPSFDCTTTTLTPDLSVTINKTNNADGAGGYSDSEVATAVGANVPFRAVITNTSKVPVVINTLTDTWPGAPVGGVCANLIGTTLAANGSVTCDWTENGYAPADGASKTNTARVVVNEVGKVGNTAQATDTSVVATSTPKNPDLVILKTGPSTAVSGTEVDYKLKVTNNGNAAKAAPITVTDVLPAGETFVSATEPCTATAGPGQTVTCVVNKGLAIGASFEFTVRVRFADNASGDYKDCAKVEQSAESCVTTTVTPVLSLTVVKTNDANQDGTYNGTETAKTIGQAVAFRALITNTSKVAVQLDSITDAIGAGAATAVCDGDKNAVLAANGGSVLCSFTLQNYAPANGTLVDTVRATGHEVGKPANTVNASGQSTVIAPAGAPALTVLKTGPATAVAGTQVDYAIKVTNNGTATANAPITVTDTLPAGETFVSSSNTTCAATAGPGQTVTCTLGQSLAVGADTSFTVRVQFASTSSGNFTDCARVGDSQSCVTTTVQKPDLRIDKTGPTTIKPGELMTYTLTVTNIGPIPTSGFVVTDTMPAGLTLESVTQGAFTCAAGVSVNCTHAGTLAPNGKAAITFTARLAAIYTAPSVINTAVVNPTDDTPQNNTSTWITPVEQPGTAEPDLSIVKTGPAIAKPGGQITYTLTVQNIGTVETSGFTVTDPLAIELSFVSASGSGFSCMGPGVSCTYPGVLKPGAKAAITVVTTLSEGFKGSSVINTATVNPPDGTPENNTSTFIVPVEQPGLVEPDLSITKAGPGHAVNPGDTFSWTMTVNNIGTVAATGFTVTDELPAALTLVSIGGNGFTCDTAAVRCTYPGTLAAGGSVSLSLSTTLASSYTGTSVTNVTVVGPDDATPENNRATATTPVNQESAPPLPFTGSNTYQMLLGALTLLSVGAALVLAGRRRKLWTV